MTKTRVAHAAVSAGLAFALTFAQVPTVAFAATDLQQSQAELESARARLDELEEQCASKFTELEERQADLLETNEQISATEEQISVKEAELTEARAVLSESMADNYKSGMNFLSFLFGSNSFDDLVSRVYYADKVAEHQSDAINTVLDIQKELDTERGNLEAEKKTQEDLAAQAQEAATELQGLAQEQQEYVNGLSAEVQAAIEAERAAARAAAEEQARKEAEARAQQEAAERAQQQAAENAGGGTEEGTDGGDTSTTTNNTSTDTTSNTTSNTSTQTNNEVEEYDYEPETPTVTPNTSGRPVSNYGTGVAAAIEYAKSQVGVSYSWGGNAIGGVEFDCSGLVWWAFQQAGISIPRGQRLANGVNNSMIGWCMNNGGWTTSQANLQAGDLMFWGSSTSSTSHVALCIGGGQMIHSNWGGVEITSVYYSSGSFVGGGPIV